MSYSQTQAVGTVMARGRLQLHVQIVYVCLGGSLPGVNAGLKTSWILVPVAVLLDTVSMQCFLQFEKGIKKVKWGWKHELGDCSVHANTS
jgi:hypothetical protein